MDVSQPLLSQLRPRALRARLGAHLHSPLYRNGYALLFSGAATSLFGLGYWALAARLYPAEVVGVNSTLLSAMLLLAGMAQLSLNNVLVRYVPVAGLNAGRLIAGAYLASTLAALGFSLVFVLGVDVWSPALDFLRRSVPWGAGFGLAVAAWCVFALQDSALTGLRQAVWVPVENTVFAVLKIILLAVWAGAASRFGIFLSWTIPVALSLLPVNLFILGRLLPASQSTPAQVAAVPGRGRLVRFAGGNYLGTLLFLGHSQLLPLLVANRAGAEAMAYFYLPWTISTGLQLIANNLSTALTVEAAASQEGLRDDGWRVLKQSLRLLALPVLVLVLGAPWLLRVFGADYAAGGAALLRWLALAALPNVVVVLGMSLARIAGRSSVVALIQGALAALVLGLSAAWLPRFGLAGVGAAWMAGNSAVALLVWRLVAWPVLRQPFRHTALPQARREIDTEIGG